MAEQFPEESYRQFLGEVQNLFGKWNVAESTPVYDTGWRIHGCRIKSQDLPFDESVSVFVDVSRRVKEVPWNFDYEWYLSFETGAGRSALSLAVQLGAVLLAGQSFQFVLVADRDSCVENEPTEFRSREAVVEHIRRVLDGEFRESSVILQRKGIVSEDGYLLLPPQKPISG